MSVYIVGKYQEKSVRYPKENLNQEITYGKVRQVLTMILRNRCEPKTPQRKFKKKIVWSEEDFK